MALADDSEWLAGLEKEPALRGIDVKRELGACQFHFRNAPFKVSRRRFENWLKNAMKDKPVLVDGRGQSSFAPRTPEMPTLPEPNLWRDWIDANRPESKYASGNEGGRLAWYQLDLTVKRYIRGQMGLE